MARVSGGRGTNWLAVIIIVLLIIAIAVLVWSFFFPNEAGQLFGGLFNTSQ